MIDYEAVAKKYGGIVTGSSTSTGTVDYNSIAQKYGGTIVEPHDISYSGLSSQFNPPPTEGSAPPFLGILAVPGQLAGSIIGQAIIAPSVRHINENILSLSHMAEDAIRLSYNEKDPKKKAQLLKVAQDAGASIAKSGYNVQSLQDEITNAQKIKIPFLGTIPALSPEPNRALQQVAGRAIKTVGFASAGITGVTGAGAIYGAGKALEEGRGIGGIALESAEYALAGKILNYGLGQIAKTQLGQRILTSPVSQLLGKVGEKFLAQPSAPGTYGESLDIAFKKFGDLADKAFSPSTYLRPLKAPLEKIGEATGVLRTEEQKFADAKQKIKNYWQNSKDQYIQTLRYDKNSPQTLAEEGIIPERRGGKMITSDQADLVKLKALGEKQTLNNLLDSTGNTGSIEKFKELASQNIIKNFKGIERKQALVYMNQQIEALVSDIPDKVIVNVDGERVVPLKNINEIKSYLWSQGYSSKMAPKLEQTAAEAARLAGNAAKKLVENSATTLDNQSLKETIVNLNQRSGDLFQAEKFLRFMNGRNLPYGKIGHYFARELGAIVGSHLGVAGSIAGAMTADKIVSILQNPKFSVGEAAIIIAELKEVAPEIIQQAERIIAENVATQSNRLKLPKPSFIVTPNTKGTPGPNYNPPGLNSK